MNPCPCGAAEPAACTCGSGVRTRYLRRVSGPLLDRFDLRLSVRRPSVEELLGGPAAESSSAVAGRVAAARNLAIRARRVPERRHPSSPARRAGAAQRRGATRLLRRELETNRLTGRGLHRVRRVARTLSDLQAGTVEVLEDQFIAQALALRIDPYELVRAAA